MAKNFQIHMMRVRSDLHLKLDGDFDGTSAFELIDTLGRFGDKSRHIVVDTAGIKHIYPFGSEVFQKNLRRHFKGTGKLIITGKYGRLLSAAGNTH